MNGSHLSLLLSAAHKIQKKSFLITTLFLLLFINSLTIQAIRSNIDLNLEPNWKTLSVKSQDTLVDLLKKTGLPSKTTMDLLQSPHAKQLVHITPGTEFLLHIEDNQLKELRYYVTPFRYTAFKYTTENRFHSYEVILQPDICYQRASFTIKDSLFSSGKRAHLPDKLLLKLADIFNYTIDLSYALRAGDHINLLYEEYFSKNKKISNGHILAAQLITRHKTFNAFRYTDKKGSTRYYNLNGASLEQSFMRYPVEFTYISSGFTHKRKHPIHGVIKPHRAIDYAAPMNTPIKASSDGVISFLGVQKGYGKVIFIKHRHKITTIYAHLNRFTPHLKEGGIVKGGEVIGFVGMTGDATGPHLHYEFRINGIHQNPLTVKLPRGTSIASHEMNRFHQYTQPLLAQLTYNPTQSLVTASDYLLYYASNPQL